MKGIAAAASIPAASGMASAARRRTKRGKEENTSNFELSNGKLTLQTAKSSRVSSQQRARRQVDPKSETKPAGLGDVDETITTEDIIQSGAIEQLNQAEADGKIEFYEQDGTPYVRFTEKAKVEVRESLSKINNRRVSSQVDRSGKNGFNIDNTSRGATYEFYLNNARTNALLQLLAIGTAAGVIVTFICTVASVFGGVTALPAGVSAVITGLVGSLAAYISANNNGNGIVLQVHLLDEGVGYAEIDPQNGDLLPI